MDYFRINLFLFFLSFFLFQAIKKFVDFAFLLFFETFNKSKKFEIFEKTPNRISKFLKFGKRSMFGVRIEPARASDTVCKDYVTKEETRLQGPYLKMNLDVTRFPEIEPVMTRPYEWQKEVISQMETNSKTRNIIWIYDGIGNSGKTMLCKYIVLKNQGVSSSAYYLGYGKAWDIKYELSRIKGEHPKLLIFDFTRTKPFAFDMTEIYSVIEEIKNGIYLSTKFESTMVITPIPHVFVFSNELPPYKALSSDRWEFYRIGHISKKLISMNLEQRKELESEIMRYKIQAQAEGKPANSYTYSKEFLESWGL
jgi:hypothetical protein